MLVGAVVVVCEVSVVEVLGSGVGGTGVSPVGVGEEVGEVVGGVTGAGAVGVTGGATGVGVSVAVGEGDEGNCGATGVAGVLELSPGLTVLESFGVVPQPTTSGIAVKQSALRQTTWDRSARKLVSSKSGSDQNVRSRCEAFSARRLLASCTRGRAVRGTEPRMTICPYAPLCVIDREKSVLSTDARLRVVPRIAGGADH